MPRRPGIPIAAQDSSGAPSGAVSAERARTRRDAREGSGGVCGLPWQSWNTAATRSGVPGEPLERRFDVREMPHRDREDFSRERARTSNQGGSTGCSGLYVMPRRAPDPFAKRREFSRKRRASFIRNVRAVPWGRATRDAVWAADGPRAFLRGELSRVGEARRVDSGSELRFVPWNTQYFSI